MQIFGTYMFEKKVFNLSKYCFNSLRDSKDKHLWRIQLAGLDGRKMPAVSVFSPLDPAA